MSYKTQLERWRTKFVTDKAFSEFLNFIPDLLENYSVWLEKAGYIDSDWYAEEPKTIDAFLANFKTKQ